MTVSSGAEKAEKLAKKKKTSSKSKTNENNRKNVSSTDSAENTAQNKRQSAKKTDAKKTGAKKTGAQGGAKKDTKSSTRKTASVRHKESEKRRALKAKRREEKKLERAKRAVQKKQEREDRKLAIKEKKLEKAAALQQKREERRERKLELKAQREERRAVLKSEDKQQRRERIAEERKAKREERQAKRQAYLAKKQAKREHDLRVREQKRAERNEKRNAPGFGGWLAAVISLGVTTLALGTVVTYGWINMNDMQADMASGYTQSLYELNAIVDNLDADLSRAQASSSVGDRVRVLSEIAIESETAETVLERFPLDIRMTEQMSSFINRMGDSAKQMLYTVANGGELSSSQIKSLEYMYETNAKIKSELNKLIAEANQSDVLSAMRGRDGAIGESFTTLQNNTFEDPKGIQDGPFSDSVKKTNAKALKGEKEITAQEAEKLARDYFKNYKVSQAKCTGEAAAAALTVYNVNLTTPDGEMLVQISKLGGKVVEFDSYKDCSDKNFSIDRCIAIAEDFLESVGLGKLKAVWASENGTTCNLNFAPVQSGAILYPDLVKIKVCEERGIVTGMEAMSYVLNHGERTTGAPAISKERARESINGNLKIEGERLALIPFDGEEVLCYEFSGRLEGREYYVYVDAVTGEEIEVLTVVGTAQGRALM